MAQHSRTVSRALQTGLHGTVCSAILAVLSMTIACESADKRPGGSARWDPPTEGTIAPSKNDGSSARLAYKSHPFDPATMRIHPLTHMQKQADISGASADSSQPTKVEGSRINCFVEFKDRWGDTCKALGTLQVQLYRPAVEPGQERQDAKWDADLTDLAKNADWFDPVTRSYRLQLQIPLWLGDPVKDGQIKLRVVFTPSSDDGESRKLRDEYVVTRS